MAIIIDGYNLLHVTGITGRGGKSTALHQSRMRLLRVLARLLSPEEVSMTTVVFDSNDAPPGLPRELNQDGLRVLFAKDYAEADDLIEELIQQDNVPRSLLVVSSDHRLQRAARRRRASYIDSDRFMSELESRQSPRPAGTMIGPDDTLRADPPEHWIAEFADVDVDDLATELETEMMAADSTMTPAEEKSVKDDDAGTDELSEELSGEEEEFDNPFPDGYGEDLLQQYRRDDPFNPFPPGYAEDL